MPPPRDDFLRSASLETQSDCTNTESTEGKVEMTATFIRHRTATDIAMGTKIWGTNPSQFVNPVQYTNINPRGQVSQQPQPIIFHQQEPAPPMGGQGATPVVQIGNLGQVMGRYFTTENGYQYEVFRAFPYAEPPGRFQKTVPKQPWTGVYDSTEMKKACAKVGGRTPAVTASDDSSEDCLYMKVLRPSGTTGNGLNGRLLPVIFWSHGGGFSGGSPNDYDLNAQGDNIVSKNVILVQPTYRVGPFGFFATGSPDAAGNYAMWDVLTGLRFVNQNIRSFGGDPNQITLMGQGAGGISTSVLTLSPQARGLFQRAIMLSGSVFLPAVDVLPSENIRRNQAFAQAAGCYNPGSNRWDQSSFPSIVSCLKSKSTDEILSAAVQSKTDGSLQFHPTVDGMGGIIPMPFRQLARQRPNNIAVIMGDTNDESAWDLFVLPSILPAFNPATRPTFQLSPPADLTLPHNRTPVEKECNRVVSKNNFYNPQEVIDLCKTQYTVVQQPSGGGGGGTDSNNDFWWKQTLKVGSGYQYHAAVKKDLDFQLANGNRQTYLFSLDYIRSQGQPSNWWTIARSFHNLDIAFIESFFPAKAYKFQLDNNDRIVRDTLTFMIGNFAKNGDPSGQTARWARYTGDNYMSVTNTPQMKTGYHPEDVYFWNVFVPSVVGDGNFG